MTRALAFACVALICWTVSVTSVVNVVDGDTADLRLRAWMQIEVVERVRLLGVDAPERGEPGYEVATRFTRTWLEARAGRLTLTACRRDSFGRPLGIVAAPDGDLAAALISAGHGVVYEKR